LIEVTGVTATTATIKTRATMEMGLLAGSSIMTLSLIWGSVVAFGSYDLSQPSTTSSYVENKAPFSLTGFPLTLVNHIK
jgi:hypothetical protein